MFKLVISYDHRTKKCQAGPGIEGIETEIKTKFFVNKPFHLQYFDKEVDEFIDLDSIDDLSCDEYTKLRVITTNMDNTPLSPNLARSDTPVECPSTPILVNGSRPTTPLSVSSLSSTSTSLDISDYRPVTPPLPKLCSPPGRSSSANMTEKTSPSTDVKRYFLLNISMLPKLHHKIMCITILSLMFIGKVYNLGTTCNCINTCSGQK